MDSEAADESSGIDEVAQQWTHWAQASYPSAVADQVADAAVEVVRRGGSPQEAYEAAVRVGGGMHSFLSDSRTDSADADFSLASRQWTEWSLATFSPETADAAARAALKVLRGGGSQEAAHLAALAAGSPANAQPSTEVVGDRQTGVEVRPLQCEVAFEAGTVGLSDSANSLVRRSRRHAVLSGKQRVKDSLVPLNTIARVLVVSRDRLTYAFEVVDKSGKSILRVNGVTDRRGLDSLMNAIRTSSPGVAIDLAHPSHGLRDPMIDEIMTRRKHAEDFNKRETRARADSGREEVKVKTYTSSRQYRLDVSSMAKKGWRPQGQTSGRGGVALGGTAAKLALTGGLGAVTGFSRKSDKITVTYTRQLPIHSPRDFLPVPAIPEPRTFPPEPYVTVSDLEPIAPGSEFPDEVAVDGERQQVNVLLDAAGPNKIAVIKLLRSTSAVGMREAKYLVDSAPQLVLRTTDRDQARGLVEELNAIGATAYIQEPSPDPTTGQSPTEAACCDEPVEGSAAAADTLPSPEVPAGADDGQADPGIDLVTALTRLSALHEAGALSAEEFQAAKERLLKMD